MPVTGAEPTRMVEVVYPQHLNHQGNLFGGEALRMMDTCAFVAATRHARRTVVTVSVEHVRFIAPVHHGEIAEMAATVVDVGRSSLQVDVELVAETLLTGERRDCGTGRFAFVAVDDGGRPVAVGG